MRPAGTSTAFEPSGALMNLGFCEQAEASFWWNTTQRANDQRIRIVMDFMSRTRSTLPAGPKTTG
jgi:hypothetical protein